MIDVQIKDGGGTRRTAVVLDDQSLFVTANSNPAAPGSQEQKTIVFRQYFTIDGTKTGTSDMRTDGSTTNVDFYISAHTDRDRYITRLSFQIADASATLNKFGNITALTNGCQLIFDRGGIEDIEIHDALKTNWDFIRLCAGNPPLGGATDAFKANNVSGSSEGYIPVLKLNEIMPPYGIKIPAGTRDRLLLRVRDNTSTVDSFNLIGYGFERLP